MKSLRVVLVNAPPLAVLEKWFDEPEFGRPALAYLAGYLRQFPGFDITIIDAKFERLSFEQVLARFNQQPPDVIGFTAFTNEIKPCAYLAAKAKKLFPGVVTVIGGAHATATPIATLNEFPSFDLVAVGEGEITFHELCEALRQGGDVGAIPGLAYRDQGVPVLTEMRERIVDQDSIPYPAWDMLPPAKMYWVQTERGCPFHCHFCLNHNGRVARKRSVENSIGEIELLVERYQPTSIRFGDELFSVDMARTHRLLDAIIERGINQKVSFDCQTHVRFVDYPILKKMKQANFSEVDLGVETGDEESLRKMGKGTTREQIIAAGAAARRAGIPFGTFIIIGQPNETPETLAQTTNLAVSLNPDYPIVGIMTPYPGTEISRLAARGEAGYELLTTDWDEYNRQIGSVMAFKHFTRRQLEWHRLMIYVKLYAYNRRPWDLVRLFFRFRSAAVQAVKNVIWGQKKLRDFMRPPSDYDEMLAGGRRASINDIVDARQRWDDLQKREMVQIRRSNPQLLRIITVETPATV